MTRTAGQVGGLFLEVTQNEEAWGIPAKSVSMLFIAGWDWMHCKEVDVTATQTISPRHGRFSSAGSTSQKLAIPQNLDVGDQKNPHQKL